MDDLQQSASLTVFLKNTAAAQPSLTLASSKRVLPAATGYPGGRGKIKPLTPRASRLTPHGFTYIGLLIFIALIGVALAGTGMVWHTDTIRAKEAELLFIGDQYRGAIGRYHESIPGSAKKYPRSIEDLLKDNRYPGVKRYLRKIYRDPMTGNTEWGIVASPDGGVMGVHSLSYQDALKTGNFHIADRDFEGKLHYSDWKFTYAPSPTMEPEGGADPAPKSGAPNSTGVPPK